MSIQKAVEYLNKTIECVNEYTKDSLNSLLNEHLKNILQELNKKENWENIEKCECGKYSVCHLFKKDGTKIYLCWDCFFKYEIEKE